MYKSAFMKVVDLLRIRFLSNASSDSTNMLTYAINMVGAADGQIGADMTSDSEHKRGVVWPV